MATEKTPRRLGRGLEALLGNASGLASSDEGALKSIPIGQIGRNPFQPRREFNSEELGELQESLNSSGLLQPITVRRRPGKDGFELIAGERRLRAAMKLGWKEIPAIIKDIDDKTVLTLALVENLQRTDLNPIEEAMAYRRLADQFHDELAGLVTGTIERWDAAETSTQLELLLGRDLQFIRINGTVVGAGVGLALHAIALALA